MADITPLQPDDHPLMTPKEAAAKLGISLKVLMQEVHAGRLRYVRIGAGNQRVIRRFTPKNLATYITNQKIREVPECQSTNKPVLHTTGMTSKSTVVAFSELSKPAAKKKPPIWKKN